LTVQPVTATLASSASITLTAFITAPTSYGRDALISATATTASQTTPTISATVVSTLTLRGYRLLSTVDPQNNQTQFAYNSSGYLGQVSDPTGQRYLTFGYDGQARLTSVTDHFGRSASYGYDANNNLSVITDTRGLTWTYTYTTAGGAAGTPHYLHEVIEPAPERRVVERTFFDSLGRAYRQENGLGQLMAEINYLNTTTRVITESGVVMTDTLSRISRNFYDSAGRLERSVENYQDGVYSAGTPDEDIVTTYGYDSFGRQISVTDVLGHVSRTEYDSAGRVYRSIVNYSDGVYSSSQPDQDIITQFEYDANGNVIRTLLLPGSAEQRVSCTVYDQLNRVKRTLENCLTSTPDNPASYSSAADQDLATLIVYDAVGNQIESYDPLNRRTSYGYDALNRTVAITAPLTSVVTRYSYDPAGNRLSMTDAEGRVSRFEYDRLNRVITTTQNYQAGQPSSSEVNVRTIVSYDSVGNRVKLLDGNGNPLTYTYDSLYRLKSTIDALNQSSSVTYDALGNKLTQTDAEGIVTRFDYDELDRVTLTTQNYVQGGPNNPETNVTTAVSYNGLGWRLRVTDGRGNASQYGYDLLGRTVAMTDALGLVNRTTYDGLGNRRSVTNGDNETTTFNYDGVNRLRFVTNALNQVSEYRYNKAGERTAMIDPSTGSGQVPVETRYGYDALGRLISVTENYLQGGPSDNQTNLLTQYGYDRVGNRQVMTDAKLQVTNYQYDKLNRVIEMRDGLNNTTRYGYDGGGNRKVITDANTLAGTSGAVTSFNYDALNRLTDILYSDSTPDVSLTYDKLGNRKTMSDGLGQTLYTYDKLYRLTQVSQPAAGGGSPLVVAYGYDRASNRTRLTYPVASQVVTYTYDAANRLQSVQDWQNGHFGYNYDSANRLTGLTITNTLGARVATSGYVYDEAGRLDLLTHASPTQTLASYDYRLDAVGNRTALTETLIAIQSSLAGAFLESGGQVVAEAENYSQVISGASHQWLTATAQSGYTGTSYLHALPDLDALYQTSAITTSPVLAYPINFTTPGTYTVWLRGFASNAAGDSAYVGLGSQLITVTGFTPGQWSWTNKRISESANQPVSATLTVSTTGLYTVSLWVREDGLRLDRLLLTTSTTFIPTSFGPAESARLGGGSGLTTTLTHTIVYTYDNIYRLTNANYNTHSAGSGQAGEVYAYSYDQVGNRLQQIIAGNTTSYQYDAANRLSQVNGQSYSFDANGNLRNTGTMTNTWDAANRLITTQRATATVQPIYNRVGDRVAQTVGATTTNLALDSASALPEVIYTSAGNSYLHLPGVIMAQSASGERRYLLSDGLGSVRQAVDDTGSVVAYNEFDPYGNPIVNRQSEIGNPYGFTGEWWQAEVGLLHLRARWHLPSVKSARFSEVSSSKQKRGRTTAPSAPA
jgi:YD repeat-containing protein